MKEDFFKFPSTPHLATMPGVEIRGDLIKAFVVTVQFQLGLGHETHWIKVTNVATEPAQGSFFPLRRFCMKICRRVMRSFRGSFSCSETSAFLYGSARREIDVNGVGDGLHPAMQQPV